MLWGRAALYYRNIPNICPGTSSAARPALPAVPPGHHRGRARVAALLWFVVARTRLGMLIPRGAIQPRHGRRRWGQHPGAVIAVFGFGAASPDSQGLWRVRSTGAAGDGRLI